MNECTESVVRFGAQEGVHGDSTGQQRVHDLNV